MEIRINIETDNAAFEDDPRELARILQLIAAKLGRGDTSGREKDMNGNTVATFTVRDPKPHQALGERRSI